MKDVTLGEALGNATLRPILQKWAARHRIDDQVEFLLDLRAKKPNKYLYETYIAVGSPNQINVGTSLLDPLRDLAAKGDDGYKAMTKPLTVAASEVAKLVDGAFNSTGQSFAEGVDYLMFRVNSRSSTPDRAAASLKLKGPKRDQFVALFNVYLKPRSISDAHQAYLGMQKLATKSKLDSVLVHSGKPAGPVEEQYQAFKLAAGIKKAQEEAERYFTTAIATVKKKGKPGNPIEVNRMFSSGRSRHEAATGDYTKAVKLDKAFHTKYPTVAADKKKIDELWAEYRKMLGK